jgi:hypothetical protein
MRAPLAAARAGAGVWKLKWRGGDSDDLLAACMTAGAAVFDARAGAVRRRLTHAGHGDGALVYGIEWLPDGLGAASCAFYARSVQVWQADAADAADASAASAAPQAVA